MQEIIEEIQTEEEEGEPAERILPGEVVADPDYVPEKIEEIISRCIEEALQPLKKALDELSARHPTPRYRIEERPLSDRPFSVIERRGGTEEELGTFGYRKDAVNFVEFLKRGGWQA